MSTYTTRTEAIAREIIEPIEATGEATRDQYDIDAIADKALQATPEGYVPVLDAEEFWAAVERHAL